MMAQISMKKALRKYLSGKTVKIVDFEREEVRDLEEVMKALEDGAFFFADAVAAEDPEFKEAAEDMQKEGKLRDELLAAQNEIQELRKKMPGVEGRKHEARENARREQRTAGEDEDRVRGSVGKVRQAAGKAAEAGSGGGSGGREAEGESRKAAHGQEALAGGVS